tara:strand:+ start:379 stop:612 length:234 start_codon:yes stop_codon:yes gene_type:complete
MSEENNVITLSINDEEKQYSVDDFDVRQKAVVMQIQDLQGKINQLQFQLDQAQPAYNFYVNELIESLSVDGTEKEAI